MKRLFLFVLLFFVVLSLPGCLKVAQQAQVMSQADIDSHNDGKSDDPTDPEPSPDPDPSDPVDPDDPAPSDDRITDGSAYFVRPTALGLKDGSSWNNALDAAGLRELIAQKLGQDGKQDDDAAFAQAAQLDNAKFYFCAGKYLLADPDSEAKVLKLEWSGYTKQVHLEFYGGYAGNSSGIDLSQRNPTSNVSMLTGDANDNRMVDESDIRILLLGNQIDLLIDGMTLAYAFRDNNGAALTLSSGAGKASATLTNCIVRDNCVTTTARSAAGVLVQRGTLIANNSRFSGNEARNGAALATDNENSVIEATSCVFQNNTASNCGGALNIASGTVTFSDCTFNNNKSGSYGGGAIHANGKKTKLTCTGCNFTSNEGNNYGGAISMETADVTLTNCNFTGNKASTGKKGEGHNNGGIVTLLKASSLLTMSGCTFKGNESEGTGGALFLKSGRAYIDNCRFEDSKANNRGVIRLCGEKVNGVTGGLCYMNSCTITGSSVTGQWGVALQMSDLGAFCANNCTIANSTAPDASSCTVNGSGNGIYVNCTVADVSKSGTLRAEGGKTFSLINSVFVNTDNSKNAVVYGGDATVTSYGSCIIGMVSGTSDTKVFNPGTGDLRDANFGNLSMNWDSANYVYKWSGTISGQTPMATADIDNLVKNALPITVKGYDKVNDVPTEIYSVSNVGQDFYNWVTGTLGSSFTSDALGKSRGTAATCGAYQAN